MLKNDLSNQINSKIGMSQQQALQAKSQALSGLNSEANNAMSRLMFH